MYAARHLATLATVLGHCCVAFGAVGPITDLRIVNKFISPDGHNRSTILAGASATTGQFPGPLISGNKGDEFQLNVIDELFDESMLRSTSIHWHGFFQKHSSWADGPAFVTQCPISPGDSFLYSFSVPDQAGTFWYHSHLSTQYCDGLRGPFVVYDPQDPHRSLYDIDNEDTVITLADWYHTPSLSAGPVPVSDATLINGRGRFQGGPPSDLSVIQVKQGSRYRFRLVSISCDPNFVFSIDGHTMTIIEVDGVNSQPYTVDSIQIFAGQRYSFILNADQPISNYWIRALPNLGFDNGVNSAILRYNDAEDTEPESLRTTRMPLKESDLVPLDHIGTPGGDGVADVSINLDIAFDPTTFKFTVNDIPYENPTAPVLLQILSGAGDAKSLLPDGSVYALPPNKVIELSIPALLIGGPHPFHLHGHTFDVVRSAGSSSYNYKNPIRRDVVNTGVPGDNVTIRFTTDNPGPWFLHCHIDWHLELGLAIVFAEDTTTLKNQEPPASWDDLCPKYSQNGATIPPQNHSKSAFDRILRPASPGDM